MFSQHQAVKSRAAGLVTENVQEGPGSHRGDAAAAERRLALVVAAVADRGQADDQSTAKVPDAGVYHHAVFPPSDTHFDEGSGGEKKKKKTRWKGRKKSERECGFLIQIHILFQGYGALREQRDTSVILIKSLNWR